MYFIRSVMFSLAFCSTWVVSLELTLQGSLFEPRFLRQVYIFHPKSLAKGVFLTKPPKKWHFGTKLASVFGKFLFKILGLKFLKIMQKWARDQEMLLSQGYVFDQNFLSQGYPIENRCRTPPSKFFRSTPPGRWVRNFLNHSFKILGWASFTKQENA